LRPPTFLRNCLNSLHSIHDWRAGSGRVGRGRVRNISNGFPCLRFLPSFCKISNGNHSGQALAPVQHEHASYFLIGHKSCDLVGRLVLITPEHFGSHHIAGRTVPHVFSIGDAAQNDISICNGSDEAIILADGYKPDIQGFHGSSDQRDRRLRRKAFHFRCHQVFCEHRYLLSGIGRKVFLQFKARCVTLRGVPYRIDAPLPPDGVLDQLLQLGALDVEPVGDGFAAILPDSVTPGAVAEVLGLAGVIVSPAVARDDGSVWLLSPRAVRVASLLIATPDVSAAPDALRLTDSTAFGTGHHPTTALCVEALAEACALATPDIVLDVGTGSGVLALAALKMGVTRATGVDIDAHALDVAAENARLNNLADRLQLVLGGPDAVTGVWPLVMANVLAAPLIEVAPVLIRRVGNGGRLILSGIPSSLESEVWRVYRRLGLRPIRSETRDGWAVLVLQASW